MSSILFHGSQESLIHITDRLKHHRLRRDPTVKEKSLAPQALVVDDDAESIQPLQLVLKQFGFETTLAFDGKEAFDEISKKTFDIVFLDICLPEMTGLQVLEQVEKFQREHQLPVITYSSYPMGEFDLPNGKTFYFAGHWQKPITLPDLASLTRSALNDLKITKN